MYQIIAIHDDKSCKFYAASTAEIVPHRLDQLRGLFISGQIAKFQLVQLCAACNGTGQAADPNKKRARAGWRVPCKSCNESGIVPGVDVVEYPGN